MKIITYQGAKIYLLGPNDMLTACSSGSYAVFEDSGWLAVKVSDQKACLLHTDPLPRMADALAEIAHAVSFFA